MLHFSTFAKNITMADEVQNDKAEKAPERAPERAQAETQELAVDKMRQDSSLDKGGLNAINSMEQGRNNFGKDGIDLGNSLDRKNIQDGYLDMTTGKFEPKVEYAKAKDEKSGAEGKFGDEASDIAAKRTRKGSVQQPGNGNNTSGTDAGSGDNTSGADRAGGAGKPDGGLAAGGESGGESSKGGKPDVAAPPKSGDKASEQPGDKAGAVEQTGPVKKDQSGRVTEVQYPDGNSRKFEYDSSGRMSRIIQPDGRVFESDNGVFRQPGSSTPGGFPPGMFQHDVITNPRVENDGTITYSENGLPTKVRPDGTSEVKVDGATVQRDAQDRPTKVEYKDGNVREFEYDGTKLSGITENGHKFSIHNEELYNPRGENTGRKNIYVGRTGHLSYTESNGDYRSFSPDGSQSTSKANGSYVDQNTEGKIVRIGSGSSNQLNLEYDQSGQLKSLKGSDGKSFDLHTSIDVNGAEKSEYRAADGSVMRDLQVGHDGTLKYQDQNGKLHTRYSNGNHLVTTKTKEELDQRAKEINQGNGVLSSGSHLQKSLEDLNAADKVALNESYRQQFGTTLKNELKSESWNPIRGNNFKDALSSINEAELLAGINDRLKDPDSTKAAKMLNDFSNSARTGGASPDSINSTLEKANSDLQKSGSPEDVIKGLEKNFGEVVPSYETLGTRYGVKSEQTTNPDGTNGRKYFIEGSKGEKLPVLESKTDNPMEIEKQLKEWQAKKITELEGKFNISLSKDGQKSEMLGKTFDLRTPRIDELMGLEKGLTNSQPSNRTANDKPIQVQFPVKQVLNGGTNAWAQDLGEHQRVVYEPKARDFDTMHRVTLHEFGHVAENNASKRDAKGLEKYYSDLGYRQVSYHDSKGDYKSQWQLRDRDGHYYAQQAGEAPFGKWTRVNEQGQPLKADGTVAKSYFAADAVRYSNQEMRNKAAIAPTSEYFPTPREQVAESLTQYRDNADTRRALHSSSAQVYQATKEFDQREIDSVHGKNPDGSSKLIRLPDASLAPNNDANRKAVSDFEKSLESSRPASSNPTNDITPPGVHVPNRPNPVSPFLRRPVSGAGAVPHW